MQSRGKESAAELENKKSLTLHYRNALGNNAAIRDGEQNWFIDERALNVTNSIEYE